MHLTHPILEVLEVRGHSITWLARRTGYHRAYLSNVFHGRHPASRSLRALIVEVLELPESQLFLPEGQFVAT